MKTQMEEVEDDLAAEEENKLINEVCSRICPWNLHSISVYRNTRLGTLLVGELPPTQHDDPC
jgi:hypothetical protein